MNAAAHIPDWMLEFARLEHHLENALQYSGGTHTVEDVFKGIAEGQFQLWTGPDSVIVTEVVDFPQCKMLQFFLAGGAMEEIAQMEQEIVEWARKQGCTKAALAGRKGWARSFLKGRGYRPTWYAMSREI